MIIGKYPSLRLRRSRKDPWSRRLIQENTLSPNDFILPIFLIEGSNKRQEISSMPGVYRYTINRLSQIVDKAIKLGIPMIALFPKTQNSKKDELGTESLNEKNLVCRAIQEIKKRYKNQIGIMCDVALDPYTSHGHDGLLNKKYVLNDETVKIYVKPNSLYIMSGEARYNWYHQMLNVKTDTVRGKKIDRKTRISLTFKYNFFPRVPPGWCFAKSFSLNPFKYDKHIANASPITN